MKKAKAAYDAAKDTASNEADVYDHLYRFFERYYDNGDFMSRRYFARETDGKAAPYAVPYDGREVYLHWANRDQYYIKTCEYLTNFTFDPTAALSRSCQAQDGATGEAGDPARPLPHRRGRRGRARQRQGRRGKDRATSSCTTENPVGLHRERRAAELVIHFEYRPRPGEDRAGRHLAARSSRRAQTGADQRWLTADWRRRDDYVAALTYRAAQAARDGSEKADARCWRKYLDRTPPATPSTTSSTRTWAASCGASWTSTSRTRSCTSTTSRTQTPRASSSTSPRSRCIRRIAGKIIDFLAQLEDFQKKLWLKKKFVVETQYCITLDRIPEEFYPEIAANDAQREEWVQALCHRRDQGRPVQPGYSKKLTPGVPEGESDAGGGYRLPR